MGDMSGKLGKLQIGNRYRVVYTDNFLSLVGDNSGEYVLTQTDPLFNPNNMIFP